MRIALTSNGPGEVAGWVRPLVRALYERDPQLEVHLFLVPDEYATGGEARMARDLFARAHVHEPRSYLGVALGRMPAGLPERFDVVQYLGGDLMHAARLHKQLGGVATTYKFSRPGYRRLFERAFAVDAKNVEQLLGWKTPSERIERIGNLAIDGALIEAAAPAETHSPDDGILIMPGSRAYEVENLVPFFFTAALHMVRERPGLKIGFGISPFTPLQQVRDAIERGALPQMYSQRGRLHETGGEAFLESLDGSTRFPVVRNALAAASKARLALTIPGTKCIELATVGVPTVAITPFNAPEKVTINGPLTYLDRVPLFGAALKRAVAVGVARRFVYHTQPNIDADAMVIRELHGTLTPGRVARVTLDSYDDAAWLDETARRLRGLYGEHVGASGRMAESLLRLGS